jgi:hypothetical protein
MPVLSNDDKRVLGIVTLSDLARIYDKEVQEILKIKEGNSDMISSLENSKSFDTDIDSKRDQNQTKQ